MICFAHRGAGGHAPENTIAAVHKGVELGADWIEVDVHAVKRELIVIHDDRLERTTNGRGYVADQSLDYLESLDAGDGQPIPTLAEVFDAVDQRAGINVELKGRGATELLVRFLQTRIARGWPSTRILVSSFDHRQLRVLQNLETELRIGALFAGLPTTNAAFAEALGAWAVHPSIGFIDEAFVADAHGRGLMVFPFTANHPDDIARMGALGVDGVFTDYPERVVAGGL